MADSFIKQEARKLCGCSSCGGDRHEDVCWVDPITRGIRAGLNCAAEICAERAAKARDAFNKGGAASFKYASYSMAGTDSHKNQIVAAEAGAVESLERAIRDAAKQGGSHG